MTTDNRRASWRKSSKKWRDKNKEKKQYTVNKRQSRRYEQLCRLRKER